MRIKKTAIAIMVFSVMAMVVSVNFADAQIYTPLVQIPGLPPGAVDLSMYLVGLYDFLLSIVGIVAVMMLIIGGMRYITAAGNQAAVADAKDIITNALLGLLLAILSWVIVAEINPDVLYIKKPGGAFVRTPSWNLEQCGFFDPTELNLAITCTCSYPRDILHNPPIVPPPTPTIIGNAEGVTDQATCDHECRRLGFCGPPEHSCIVSGTPNNDLNKELTKSFGGLCQCLNGIKIPPVGDNCHETCLGDSSAGFGYPSCSYIRLRFGFSPGDYSKCVDFSHSEEFSIKTGDTIYYKFNVYDPMGLIVFPLFTQIEFGNAMGDSLVQGAANLEEFNNLTAAFPHNFVSSGPAGDAGGFRMFGTPTAASGDFILHVVPL